MIHPSPVIPAKAGTRQRDLSGKAGELGLRFRGDDNSSATRRPHSISKHHRKQVKDQDHWYYIERRRFNRVTPAMLFQFNAKAPARRLSGLLHWANRRRW